MNNDISQLSHAYWSDRAEEFSALRMEDYESPLYPALRTFIAEYLPGGEGPFVTSAEAVPGSPDTVSNNPQKSANSPTRPRAVDAGCGAGFFSLMLAELGCHVTGIDFSEAMLEQATKNAVDKGYTVASGGAGNEEATIGEDHAASKEHSVSKARNNISFQRMDIQALEFPDESFDAIVTRNVTWVLPDAGKAYSEMMRVLRPGGILINMDSNYGRVFNQSDARGETPTHPTQTLDQLRMRNRIARDLDITAVDRPEWDIITLWQLGAESITCHRDLEHLLAIREWNEPYTRSSARSKATIFAVIAQK